MSTTNAGALAVVVEADTASFESSMSKVGASAEREMQRVERANASAKAEGDRFVAMVKRQVDSFGLTGTALLAYEARLKGVSAEAQPLIDRLNRMKDAQTAFNQQAASASGLPSVGKGLKDTASAADGAAHATSGITRELIVLAHEASQGNFKRFGGSLLVLAEYSGAAQKALSALIGPVGLGIAGIALLGVAAYEGAKQADELRKSLVLTGNFAGTTAAQFDVLARAVSAATSSGIAKASAAIQALVSTGEVGPRLLGDMATATVKLESLTGKSAEEIVKDFAKMQEAPTKWAAEANKAYNFLSTAQYDHIKLLDEEGNHEQAAIEVLKSLNDHLGTKIPESLTGLGKALHSAGMAWDEFWHSAMHKGAPDTVQDQIEAAQKRLADLQHPGNGRGAVDLSETVSRGRTRGDVIASTMAEIAALQARAKAEQDAAIATAARQKADKEGIAASDYFTQLEKELKGVDRLKRDLAELDAMERKRAAARVADGKAAVQPGDAQEHTFDVAAITHRDRSFQDKADDRLSNAIKERLALYDEEKARISDEGAQYTMYGKVLDKTAEAIARVETETGKFAKASDQAKASMVAAAQAVDRAEAYKKEAEAQALAAKQREKDSQALTKHLADNAIATQIEIEKLSEDTRYLSLNTLERQIAIKALEIEKQRRVELADPKNAGHEGEINDSALKRTQEITRAMTQADAVQKSFGFGASRAWAQYSEGAANSAKFAESFVGGSLQHIEDALATFAETGKLSFKSLFTFMADEFIRNQIRMQITGAGGSGGSLGLFGALAGAFGAGGGAAAGGSELAAEGGAGMAVGASFANGIGYVPYDGMPAILHEGEKVLTRQEAQKGQTGGGTVIHFDQRGMSFGAGVSAAEVAQQVRTGMSQAKADVYRSLSTNGRAK